MKTYRVPVEFKAETHEEARQRVAFLDAGLGDGETRVVREELAYESIYFSTVPQAEEVA